MTEKEWRKELLSAMALDKRGKHDEAISSLKRVLKQIRTTYSLDFSYEQDALSLIGMIYEHKGDLKRAAEFYLKAAKEHDGWLKYHTHAAAYRLAMAAVCQFKSGNPAKGAALGKQALRLAKLDIDPSPIFEELLTHLRDSYEKQALKKRKRNRGG